MEMPNEIVVKVGIQQGQVYNFAPKDGVPNHYFVVLNKDPKNGDVIHLAPFTTKKANVLKFIKFLKLDAQTFVELLIGECPFLARPADSGIDCNRLISPTLDELVQLIDLSDGSVKYPTIEASLLVRVIAGVKVSRLVSQAIKDTL